MSVPCGLSEITRMRSTANPTMDGADVVKIAFEQVAHNDRPPLRTDKWSWRRCAGAIITWRSAILASPDYELEDDGQASVRGDNDSHITLPDLRQPGANGQPHWAPEGRDLLPGACPLLFPRPLWQFTQRQDTN